MLVARYHQPMLRLARTMVSSEAVAEEIVQDTWMGVVRGMDRFEARSSFKTWLYSILVNRARSAGAKEPLTTSIESLHSVDPLVLTLKDSGPILSTDGETTVRVVLDAATLAPFLSSALEDLAPRQRQVVLLRDVEGLSNDEVCGALGISSGNQRILLHRGRARLREILDSKVEKS